MGTLLDDYRFVSKIGPASELGGPYPYHKYPYRYYAYFYELQEGLYFGDPYWYWHSWLMIAALVDFYYDPPQEPPTYPGYYLLIYPISYGVNLYIEPWLATIHIRCYWYGSILLFEYNGPYIASGIYPNDIVDPGSLITYGGFCKLDF